MNTSIYLRTSDGNHENKKPSGSDGKKATPNASGSKKRKAPVALFIGGKQKWPVCHTSFQRSERLAHRALDSSAPSEPSPNKRLPSKTPVFNQPGQKLHLSPHSSCPVLYLSQNHVPSNTSTQFSQTQVNVNLNHAAKGTAADREDDDNGDQEDEEDPMTWHMRRLLKAKWYAAFGKAFTLKYWPWADASWWIDGDDYGGDGGELSVLEEATWTHFFEYMQILSIKESEWMTRSFRKSVMILFHTSNSCSPRNTFLPAS